MKDVVGRYVAKFLNVTNTLKEHSYWSTHV